MRSVDIFLLAIAYPVIWGVFLNELFTEVDGTANIEWAGHKHRLELYQILAYTAVGLRCLLGVNAVGLRAAAAAMDSSFTDATPTVFGRYCLRCCPSYALLLSPFLYLDSRLLQKGVSYCCSVTPVQKKAIRRNLRRLLSGVLGLALLLLATCLVSAVRHLGLWVPGAAVALAAKQQHPDSDCDPLDDTECWLPFPSFHALKKDSTAATGWRVNLQGKLLPPLKSRAAFIQPDFLNHLDGFSTMAPMLFYIEGLKEAHEAGVGQLKGSIHIAESVTEGSATLLLDVEAAALVPHTAEIDYLDGMMTKHPLIMIFPAKPLHHNRHYAVAVVNAKDAMGNRLKPTAGMQDLLFDSKGNNTKSGSVYDTDRKRRFIDVLIPTLEKSAGWFKFAKDPDALQLLFDFHTISEESQLGPVRAVRDGTVRQISSVDWDWKQHVRTNRQIDYDCEEKGAILARTVHAELDVPWFLDQQGSGARSALLDESAVAAGRSTRLGVGKFLLHIPCSLKAAALAGHDAEIIVGAYDNKTQLKQLRAVMEYGHGLFGNRAEASDDYIVQMAHDQGYVITAMDWRGMSSYDLLMVAKVLISTPRLFQAVRDNLIQGYACKYALQHFSRHALLSMDWLTFERSDSMMNNSIVAQRKSVPTLNNKLPAYVFYGVSQGGILGAGYTALSGVTGLIDRGILGSPGTPFALIMTRSRDFLAYDKLLLLDFYDNRHVRMLLTLVQMAWDSVEASGVLATPVNEPYPRILIQAGLGDVIVSTTASEALSRAFNASSLPASPRQVFGIPTAPASSGESSDYGPHATLTEVMYDREFQLLAEDNTVAEGNGIHFCLRQDKAMIGQLTEFINTGRVVDPCTNDGCHRSRVQC